ncbi:solute carrier family 23 protein [Streptomyces sp. NPDC013457]|uniref:solute carrier family 23 protein n=1 Tax=Streptomyces sp. NPDC013457 TaxID=3364866 RepID=UPI0037035034
MPTGSAPTACSRRSGTAAERGRMLVASLQHVASMYAGAVSVPRVVAVATKMSPADTAVLMGGSLLMAGIATLLRTLGIGRFVGSRPPSPTTSTAASPSGRRSCSAPASPPAASSRHAEPRLQPPSDQGGFGRSGGGRTVGGADALTRSPYRGAPLARGRGGRCSLVVPLDAPPQPFDTGGQIDLAKSIWLSVQGRIAAEIRACNDARTEPERVPSPHDPTATPDPPVP